MPIKVSTGPNAIFRAKSVQEAWDIVVKGSPLEDLPPKKLVAIKGAFFLGCSVGLHVQNEDLNKFVKEIEDYANSSKQIR